MNELNPVKFEHRRGPVQKVSRKSLCDNGMILELKALNPLNSRIRQRLAKTPLERVFVMLSHNGEDLT